MEHLVCFAQMQMGIYIGRRRPEVLGVHNTCPPYPLDNRRPFRGLLVDVRYHATVRPFTV